MSVIFLLIGLFLLQRIVVLIYENNWNKKLEVLARFEEAEATEGETGHIKEILSNGKLLPIPAMTVRFELDKSITYKHKTNIAVSDRQHRTDAVSLMGNKRMDREFEVKFTKRGFYRIDSVSVSTSDAFSSKFLSQKYDTNSSIYVYPAHSRYTEILAPFSRMTGEAVKNRFIYEDPFEFKGIRDYSSSDPMRKINWRASAKTGDLKVNSYYDTTSRQVTIFLDIVNDQIWRHDEQVEECIRIARNYMENFVANKIPVKIVTNGLDIETGNTIEFLDGLDAAFIADSLRKLARIDMDKRTTRLYDFFDNNTINDGELAILLSADISENMLKSYEHYLGNQSGEWVATIGTGTKDLVSSRKINITYLEVGR